MIESDVSCSDESILSACAKVIKPKIVAQIVDWDGLMEVTAVFFLGLLLY